MPPRGIAHDRPELLEKTVQTIDVLGRSAVNDVQVPRRRRSAVQHRCRAAHDQELDPSSGQGFQQSFEVSRLGIGSSFGAPAKV